MFKLILSLIALLPFQYAFSESVSHQKLVVATKRIYLEKYPDAWNPSIIKVDEGYLLTFRYCPNQGNEPFTCYIGIVLLDDQLEMISHPKLLHTRSQKDKIPSQSEDARIFEYRGRLFLIYNDNVDFVAHYYWERRDMFIAELQYHDNYLTLSSPLKLLYEEHYNTQIVQKNWVPFEKDGTLLLSYTMNPHEVLYPNLKSGVCYPSYKTKAAIDWNFGTLRGSTPAQLVDGEYLAFFHSGIITSSPSSQGNELWHYFMGAYTFSAEAPFEITKMTPTPIMDDEFYTPSDYNKRVIFPGGFVVSGSSIYVAYGKDDSEIWIATLDKEMLRKALLPVEKSKD